ncbi:hypothetical protein PHJA_002694500 [Phtheirospermum japonicum]|uniref:Uncharacterized protein n=1 Tax=Phtheirospermum japonicum TaxID=374723 RepID=A0A830DBR3_9LAMI|nr:hypothetical protein PHJA_002694500 [Phtheirospermum japonicum]
MYDAIFLNLFEEDEAMGDFLQDMMNMMEQSVGSKKMGESLEDLQKTFMDLFDEDLADMICERDDPVVTKRERHYGRNARATPKKRNVCIYRYKWTLNCWLFC